MPKNEERASHLTGLSPKFSLFFALIVVSFLATVPTVGSALVALDDLCHDLAETLKQISDISAELAQKHQMGLDNVQEVRLILITDGTDYPLSIHLDRSSRKSTRPSCATSKLNNCALFSAKSSNTSDPC